MRVPQAVELPMRHHAPPSLGHVARAQQTAVTLKAKGASFEVDIARLKAEQVTAPCASGERERNDRQQPMVF